MSAQIGTDVDLCHCHRKLGQNLTAQGIEGLGAIDGDGGDLIHLDLEKLEYVSSSGLRILLMFLKKIKTMEGRFMLCSMTADIKEIFEISGFINIFEIYDNSDSALKS